MTLIILTQHNDNQHNDAKHNGLKDNIKHFI
jgi:hypothetical protein